MNELMENGIYASFIGGPLDGKSKWIANHEYFEIPIYPDFPMSAPNGPPIEEIYTVATYRRRRLSDINRIQMVFENNNE
jgi:hypothetical protein